MHVEEAVSAILEWYEGDDFVINGITETTEGSAADFDQSEHFISVVGFQNSVGWGEDSFEGRVYFEFEKGKFISTSFRT